VPGAYPPTGYLVQASIESAGCKRSTVARVMLGCLPLSGQITGTGSGALQPNVDETHHELLISFEAGGEVMPLGPIKALGSLRGTGFVYRGRRTAFIDLVAQHGSLQLDGQGPPVEGLTPP
jgi:hypothetical protein